MNTLLSRLPALLCLLLTFSIPSLRAASLNGESVTLTVTCSGTDSNAQPYNIVLHTSTFTVGAGVEVSGVAVSGAIPNPGFSSLPFSGTITVDVGANTMACRYQGTQGIGGCTFKLSSVADQSAGQITAPTLTSESGFQVGLNQSMSPSSDNTGTGSVSANFFWAGIHSPVDQNELVTFTLVDPTAPVLANLNGDTAAFTGTPVVVDVGANMTITDSDAPSEANIGGATVTITNFQAGDVLATTPTSPVTASYSNGVLTLSGTSTRTIYRNALRTMTFTTSSGNTTTRSISTVVTDTTARSSTASVSSVTVAAVVAAPTVTSPSQSAVTATGATLGGNVTADGGAAISARGVVVSKTSLNNDPALGGSNVTNLTTSGTTGVFTVDATGLTPSTGYSFKAYATNSQGTTYTSPVSTFTTPALPNLSINDVTLAEGNSGTTSFTFTVSLSAPAPPGGVGFDIGTSNGTATSPGDYTAKSLTSQTIPAGSSSATFTVLVNGDTSKETNEIFFVNVTSITGANVTDGQGQGTITNDDFQADLAITVTDGAATEIPGTGITYTIVASNSGPDPVVGATVSDTFPANLSSVTWTAVGADGGTVAASGNGNINELVNLPSGASVTFTVNGTISASATGSLSNTAAIAAPGSVTDPNPGNNSATDTDTLSPQADLSITKTDGVTSAVPGSSVTYTISVSNAGPSNVTGATVADTFPAVLTVSWTAVGAGGGTVSAAGSGNINEQVNLPAGGSVTFTVSATIASSATGNLSNTATVTAPGGVTDPTPANNSATDTDTLTPQADLAITVNDGVTTAVPGGSVTYTINVSNAGPSNAPAVTVADTFPASLTANWTAVGAGGGTVSAGGSGNINEQVNLPAGGSVTFTVSATIASSATGNLSNTATVSSATTDPTPGNNNATDTDTLTPQADLAITVNDGVTTAVPGGSVTYTINVSNAGPSNAPAVTVADTFPASLTANWTAVGAGGGTVSAAGSGNINEQVNLPAGGSVTFTVSATIASSATGNLSNTATVTAPGGVTDPTPGNNSATDTDTLTPQADLSITVTDGVATATPGGTVTYTITASNAGPSDAPGSTVADTFPAVLTGITWSAVGAGGGTVTASGSGNINDTVNLPAGGSVTFTVSGTISTSAFGSLSNTATVTVAGGVTDPTPGNNSTTDTDSLSTVVSITAPDADADENTAATGTWRVLRNGTSGSLTVQLAINASSTAKAADWSQSGATLVSLDAGGTGTVVIPDGQDHLDITLTPTPDLHAEAAETVMLDVTADAAYTVISPSSATVTIGQNDFVVINTEDSGEGSLRQAVLNANDLAGDDMITFDATVFATAKTITLTSGQIVISGNTFVQGTGAQLLTLNGNAAGRIFNINNNAVVGLSDLTVTNGNHTTSWGGAINVVGGSNVTLERSVVSNSTSQLQGGGIYVSNATLNIQSCTISGNTATTVGGGAIATGNSITSATVNVTNSTISGNSGPGGGAMLFGGNAVVSLNHATITNNTTSGSGAAVDAAGGAVNVANTLIAGNVDNATKPDVAGAFTSGGGNLIGNTGAATGFTATNDLAGTGASPTNARLGPLADNGGPTLTHALLNGSPAINNGLAANLPKDNFDQRGTPSLRTRGPAPDSGAFEAFAFEPTLTAANTDEDTLNASGLVITANSADGGLTTHYKITDILNGTLYQNDGTTVIPAGAFITKAEGAAGLKFLPGANLHDGNTSIFGFSAQAAVSAADADLRGVPQSTFVTVNSVNDAPTVVAPGLLDQTMIIGGNVTITLPDKFTDVDGDALAYSVLTNSKSTIATAAVIGNNLKLLALDNGVTMITVQASDGVGGTVSDSFAVQVGTTALTASQPIKQKFKVNRGNGLFEVTVKITNTTPLPVNGFRLHVNFDKYLTKYPSLRLQNADSPSKKKNVYVDYRGTVAVDGTVTLKLSFYTKDRKFPKRFKPAYAVETFKMFTAPPLLARGSAPGGAAVGLSATVLPDRSVRIGFPATAGSWYRISYTTDLKNWVDSPVPVKANDAILYWTDSGPPVTATHPADEPKRFYRIQKVSAP